MRSIPVANDPDDPYVRLNVEFASALGIPLPASLLSVLADDDDDDCTDCTEGDSAAVALHFAVRLLAAAERGDLDGFGKLTRLLVRFMDDNVDPRVVAHLAKTVGDER